MFYNDEQDDAAMGGDQGAMGGDSSDQAAHVKSGEGQEGTMSDEHHEGDGHEHMEGEKSGGDMPAAPAGGEGSGM